MQPGCRGASAQEYCIVAKGHGRLAVDCIPSSHKLRGQSCKVLLGVLCR